MQDSEIDDAGQWRLADVRDPELESVVAALYSDLPYHNFAHVLFTLDAAEDIIRRCLAEGLRIAPNVVYHALLFHDAGFHENHAELGFDSKEAYSASLAEDVLKERGEFRKVIRKVIDCIMSTHRFGSFVTVEQKATRAADLSGLAAPYDVFRRNTVALKEEYELMHGVTVPWRTWLTRTSDTIRFYLSQEIRLTSFYHDEGGESQFHRLARTNLERLLHE